MVKAVHIVEILTALNVALSRILTKLCHWKLRGLVIMKHHVRQQQN